MYSTVPTDWVNTELNVKTVLFQAIQFSISMQFQCQNSSILNNSFVEGDPKGPFSIATTPRCMEEHYSFPWITPLYPQSLPYNAEC